MAFAERCFRKERRFRDESAPEKQSCLQVFHVEPLFAGKYVFNACRTAFKDQLLAGAEYLLKTNGCLQLLWMTGICRLLAGDVLVSVDGDSL